MTVFLQDGRLLFALEAQDVPPSSAGAAYGSGSPARATGRAGSASPIRSARTAGSASRARARTTSPAFPSSTPRTPASSCRARRPRTRAARARWCSAASCPARARAADALTQGGRGVQPGSSLPGFMIPAGSQRCLAARRTSIAERAVLGLQPGDVVAADRVMVADRRARRGDRVAGGALGRAPLPARVVRVLACQHGEVERRPVGIDVRTWQPTTGGVARSARSSAPRTAPCRLADAGPGASPSPASRRARRGRAVRRADRAPRSGRNATPRPARGRSAALPRPSASARRARAGGRCRPRSPSQPATSRQPGR